MIDSTITIAIPVLNAPKYIAKAIESALNQSQQSDEVLIVNNNSSDKTLSICESYGTRVRIVSHNQTLSMADNWTSCFKLAASDFVMICHADDELFPQAIEHTKNIILDNPEVDHIFGQTWLYDGSRSFPTSKEKFGLLASEEYFLRSCASYYHYNSGTTTRKSLALGINGYSNQFKHITDVDFFIRLALKARKVYAIDKPLGTYRIHETNLHKALNKSNIADYEYISLFRRIADDDYLSSDIRNSAMKNLFPVLAQSVTKALKIGGLTQSKQLTNKISKLTEDYGAFLNLALKKNSQLIFNLCKSSMVGVIFAWLLVRFWEISRHFGKKQNEICEYQLPELLLKAIQTKP